MTPMNDDLDMTDNEFEESMAEGVDVQVATSRADYLRLASPQPQIATVSANAGGFTTVRRVGSALPSLRPADSSVQRGWGPSVREPSLA